MLVETNILKRSEFIFNEAPLHSRFWYNLRMSVLVLGINHTTAPVAIREQVAFPPNALVPALQSAQQALDIHGVILSTCNRTELYCYHSDEEALLNWLGAYHQLSPASLSPYIYCHHDRQAVRHLMRVASGLDSMVLGEPEILGQLKNAFAVAQDAGTVDGKLHRLFETAFEVAKKVRTETALGAQSMSVASAAVNLAKQIFSSLGDSAALLIGAGDTIATVRHHLCDHGLERLWVANRTLSRAQSLLGEGPGVAISLDEMPATLDKVDMVITATSSTLPILGKGRVETALKQRKRRPLLLIDLAVPRDIEAEVKTLQDVYLYTVDDLHAIVQAGRKSREQAATKAEAIIHHQAEQFTRRVQSLQAVDTVQDYRTWMLQLRDETLEKSQQLLNTGVSPDKALKDLARRLTNKVMHAPSVQLRRASELGRHDLVDAMRELFELEDN